MTGTPVENRLSDLWSLFDFLNPGLLGGPKAFAGLVKQMEATIVLSAAPHARRALHPPPAQDRQARDRRPARQGRDVGLLQPEPRAGGPLRAGRARAGREARIGRRHRAAGRRAGPAHEAQADLQPSEPARSARATIAPEQSGKFQRLAALCEELAERQEKALIFTQFREITGPLAQFLEGVFGRPGLVLHGGTPVAQRRRLVENFQREDGPPFFVLSLKAGGTGLNLTAASSGHPLRPLVEPRRREPGH